MQYTTFCTQCIIPIQNDVHSNHSVYTWLSLFGTLMAEDGAFQICFEAAAFVLLTTSCAVT